MTAATYVGGTATSSPGAATLSPGLPSGYQAGDVFVAITMISSYVTGQFSASGWTSQAHYPDGGSSGPGTVDVLYRIAASASEAAPTFTQNSGSATYCTVVVLCFRGVATTSPIRTSNRNGYSTATSSFVAPALTASAHDSLAVFDMSFTNGAGVSMGPTGMTAGVASAGSSKAASYYQLDLGAGDTGSRTSTMSAATKGSALSLLLRSLDNPPNAPTLASPATNATVDRSITQRFAWTFSDPDAGDSQSKFDLQYRTVGGATWTAITGTTPNNYWDAAASTFAAGNYEWQARTYDSQGVVGPWSASSFFTAADAPAPATITAPTSGGTISSSATVTWSAPNQTDYQIRRVKDNAGNADTSTIYYDSGDVADSTTRSVTLTFDTNNRYEHIQVRIKNNGLWSAWSDIRVYVSYTPPATPSFSLLPDATTGSIGLAITNPAPNLMPSAAAASFEDGSTGSATVVGAATLTNSTVEAKDGTHSLLVTWGTGGSYSQAAVLAGAAVSAGTYTLSAWVYVPTGSPDVVIDAQGSVGGGIASGTITGLKDAWVRLVVTVTISDSETVFARVINYASATAGQVCYIDAIQIEKAATANPYSAPGAPVVAYNDVYVTDPGQAEERRATNLPTNSTWTYWLAPAGFDGVNAGKIRVVAVGSNGASAST